MRKLLRELVVGALFVPAVVVAMLGGLVYQFKVSAEREIAQPLAAALKPVRIEETGAVLLKGDRLDVRRAATFDRKAPALAAIDEVLKK